MAPSYPEDPNIPKTASDDRELDELANLWVIDALHNFANRRVLEIDSEAPQEQLLQDALKLSAQQVGIIDENGDKVLETPDSPFPPIYITINYESSLLRGLTELSGPETRLIVGATLIEHWINRLIDVEWWHTGGSHHFRDLAMKKWSPYEKLKYAPEAFDMPPLSPGTVFNCRSIFEARNFITHYKWNSYDADDEDPYDFEKVLKTLLTTIVDLYSYEDGEYYANRAAELFPDWPLTKYSTLLNGNQAD